MGVTRWTRSGVPLGVTSTGGLLRERFLWGTPRGGGLSTWGVTPTKPTRVGNLVVWSFVPPVQGFYPWLSRLWWVLRRGDF